MIDSIKPGQTITCTIKKAPVAHGARRTLQRLMRHDPSIRKGLRHAQQLRAKRMHSYIRGNRVYYSREKAARIARMAEGNSWAMTLTPDIVPDLRSVEQYIDIKKG